MLLLLLLALWTCFYFYLAEHLLRMVGLNEKIEELTNQIRARPHS